MNDKWRQEHVKRLNTNTDADLERGPIVKRYRLICTLQRHLPCSGVRDRNAYAPIRVDEEDGKVQLRLFEIAAPIALTLRGPKLLRYNRTNSHNGPDASVLLAALGVVEKPSGAFIHDTRGPTVIRWAVPHEESTGPVIKSECPDGLEIHSEEIG
jgi:hypothetical protein